MRPYYFSEFSYGFAVTAEFVNDPNFGIIDPPEFPSLRKEGQVGGGADVRLNTPSLLTYLQFKLSDYMIGPTAAERDLFAGGPYYRFHIRNDATTSGLTQHDLLRQLNQPGNEVFYIAPAFYYEDHWIQHYRDGEVVQNSIMFSPAELGPLDNTANHVIAFENADSTFGWLCSEPDKRDAIPGKGALDRFKEALRHAPLLTVDRLESAVQKLSSMIEIAPPEVPPIPPGIADERRWDRATMYAIQAIRQLASMARSHLDCTLAVVSPE